MKAGAKAGVLADALSLATMAVRGTRKMPPLAYLATADDAISITISDADSTVEIIVTATIHAAGKITVAGERLAALISTFAATDDLSMSATSDFLTIACGGSRYRLIGVIDPPRPLALAGEIASIEISGADCLRLLEPLPAIGTEVTRYFLCGIFLHSVGDRLIATATDGVKLIQTGIAADRFATHRRLILPGKAATAIGKLIRQTKADKVTLRRSKYLFGVIGSGFSFGSRMIDAEYPFYERALPPASTSIAICTRSDQVAALARLSAVGIGDLPLMALCWNYGKSAFLFLPRQPDDGGDLIAAEANGSAEIALSLRQLMALIPQFDGGDREHVVLEVANKRSLTIRDGNKIGILTACRWNFTKETTALSA